MTPLDYIRIDADVLGLNLSSTEKLILGAVKSLDGKGMMLSNDELARLLNSKPDTVSKAIGRLESKKLIHSENRQSRYRRIYFGKKSEVESGTLRKKIRSKKDSTSEKNPATSDLIPATSDFFPNITKGTKGTEERELFGNGQSKEKITPERFIQHWNGFDTLPIVKAFSKERRGKLAARVKEETFKTHWREIIRKLAGSAFHTGQNDKGWRAGVDWILKNETNYLKILELPEPFDGVTRETTAAEFDKLLGTTADE